MGKILLEEKYILEYIDDTLSSVKRPGKEVENAKYHHNASYKEAPLICRHGILTLNDLNRYGIRNDSEDYLRIMEDTESHVNGCDCVSLSVVGLDDLYPDEDEYDPFYPKVVDFRVTSDIHAFRSNTHYGNEFLRRGSIDKEELRAVDIRFLELMRYEERFSNEPLILQVLKRYNYLIDIASEMRNQNLGIPLREMSDSNISELDIDKISSQPKLVIKSN